MLTRIQRDPSYLIIKQWIPPNIQEKLWAHTRELRVGRDASFTNPDDQKWYFIRRRSSRRREIAFSTKESESNVSEDGKTSRMKAMEIMLLYRAMLFACLLATGADTSELLRLENRNQIVQVL